MDFTMAPFDSAKIEKLQLKYTAPVANHVQQPFEESVITFEDSVARMVD